MTFLQWLGLRSTCCNAKYRTLWGWDWKRDYVGCVRCGRPKR